MCVCVFTFFSKDLRAGVELMLNSQDLFSNHERCYPKNTPFSSSDCSEGAFENAGIVSPRCFFSQWDPYRHPRWARRSCLCLVGSLAWHIPGSLDLVLQRAGLTDP